MSNVENAVSARLEADRRDLLDLTLRNPLLNYRPRARGLEFQGEVPADLFRVLVKEGKAMSFLPAREDADIEADSGEHRLRTTVPAADLQDRLLSVHYAA